RDAARYYVPAQCPAPRALPVGFARGGRRGGLMEVSSDCFESLLVAKQSSNYSLLGGSAPAAQFATHGEGAAQKSRITQTISNRPRPIDLFSQCRLGGGGEAGEQIVVDGDRLLAADARAKPAPLVAERLSDLFSQCRLGGVAKAGEQIVVDGNLLVA